MGIVLVLRLHWRRYGLLYLLSAITGLLLCYLFVKLNLYSFPYRLFPTVSSMPFLEIATAFPLLVLLGVRYSPKTWRYKIAFYWPIIHLGMLGETILLNYTDLIHYELKWDFWHSYTWWWIYLLVFEWIGGLIIPQHLRKPISTESFRYGMLLWAIKHFILIGTIFLGGYYLAKTI